MVRLSFDGSGLCGSLFRSACITMAASSFMKDGSVCLKYIGICSNNQENVLLTLARIIAATPIQFCWQGSCGRCYPNTWSCFPLPNE